MKDVYTTWSRRAIKIGALLVVLLVLIPIFGLLAAAWSPPVVGSMPFDSQSLLFWRQPQIRTLLFNTILLALLVSVFSSVMGIWLAWVERRASYFAGGLLAKLSLLPLAMPSFLLAVVIRESFAPNSLFGQWVSTNLFKGLFPSVLVLSIIVTPYVQLLVSAALSRLSAAEEEAAHLLGAAKSKVFFAIIWPQIRPAFAFAWLLSCLYVVSDFGAVAILDMPVLTWHLYQAVAIQQLSQATIIGMVLLLLTLPLLVVGRYIHGQLRHYHRVSNPRTVAPSALGGWALIFTYLCHFIMIGIGVLLPIFSLIEWISLGWWYGNHFAPLLKPLMDTLMVSFFSSVGLVCLALLPAWVIVRLRNRGANYLEYGIYLTNSLPGILLAFGLMLAALGLNRVLGLSPIWYHALLASGILLFLGYVMRFMAQTYSGVKSALLAYDPRWTDNAKMLNARRWQYFSKVWLPGVRPGLSAAFLLAFISLIKELPVTLLLGSAMGLRTLSFRIYDRYQEAFLHDVASAGLLLLSLSLCFVIVSLRWRQYVR